MICRGAVADCLPGVPAWKFNEGAESKDHRSRRGHRRFCEQVAAIRRLCQCVNKIFRRAWSDPHRTENIEISDYLQEGDVGFKKPKVSFPSYPSPLAHQTLRFQKKKRHNNKRVIESSVDAPVTADGDEKMQVDEKPIIPEARDLDANFVDDDDLQAVLARSRRAKLRKPQKLSPEEVARKSKFYPSFCLPYI